jgi:HEPN domain-containing protein
MKPTTHEWIEKAENDFHTCERELKARKHPNYDGACFHAQQCVEKYLKAFLDKKDLATPRTHDLGLIADLCLPHARLLGQCYDDLEFLTAFAVAYRYPGESADKSVATEARNRCRKVRMLVRSILNLPVL